MGAVLDREGSAWRTLVGDLESTGCNLCLTREESIVRGVPDDYKINRCKYPVGGINSSRDCACAIGRLHKSGTEGVAKEESIDINTSLMGLSNCIHALVAGNAYIPYRDSVLTTILSNALGGQSKVRTQ